MEFLKIALPEFIGTMILILLGNGIVANVLLSKTKGNRGQTSGWNEIVWAWGLAVFIGATASSLSGANLNPAVSLTLLIAGKISIANLFIYIVFQLLGAIAGQLLVILIYWNHYQCTKDPELIKFTHCTAPAIRSYVHNWFSEFIGTIILLVAVFLTIGMTRLQGTGQINNFKAASIFGPMVVGMTVVAIGYSLGGTTGYAINPVRDLGPRIVYALFPFKNKISSDWQYAWIPIVAPLSAAAVTGGLFLLFQ
ncbi:MIP/aquaporin family protein [Mycoplasma sp. SG1]|uniref:MIP/aquaporin family protein n=1 Tax=Mycoplasma sp. SG1 TaxID=2810348 RepID=UPI00202473A7|nr:MIP/aquaporin family protein [Mycoplasma sp. SG1]URM53132.1 aquaporin family protein [Mycoplasma sp. SG1]